MSTPTTIFEIRSRPLIIGFSGHIASGKTTLAKHCVQRYGGSRHSFSDPLKQIIKEVFCLDPAKKTAYVRYLMQVLATQILRTERSGVWLRAFYHRINLADPYVWIDDVRFPDEAEFIWQLGGYVIRLEPESTSDYMNAIKCLYADYASTDLLTHDSELALDTYPYFSATLPTFRTHSTEITTVVGCERLLEREFGVTPPVKVLDKSLVIQ